VIDSFESVSENIYVDSNLILNNNVSNNPTIDSEEGSVSIARITGAFTFTNNILANYEQSDYTAIALEDINNGKFINNTIVNDGPKGILAIGDTLVSEEISFINNIIVSPTIGISITDVTTTTLDYTLWYDVDTEVETSGSETYTNNHKYYGDPEFSDPVSGDYHIPFTSGAHDNGDPAGVPPAPNHDADGKSRPHNTGVDLGAYEYQGYGIYLSVIYKNYQPLVGWVVGNAVDNYGTILKTGNGGIDWVRQGSAASIPNVRMESVAAIDAQTAWVVGEASVGTGGATYGTILRTENGGTTWQRQGNSTSIPNRGLLGIYALDGDIAWVAGSNGTILHTTDGGATWTQQGEGQIPSVMYQGVYASDENNCWMVGDSPPNTFGTVIKTTDGGETWTQVNYSLTRNNGTGLIMTSGVNPNVVWVSGPGQISYTNDGGLTWIDQWNADIAWYHVNGVYAYDSRIIWLAVDNGMIFRSDDGGYNFVKQETGTSSEIMRIFATDENHAWAVTTDLFPPFEGVILSTSNGGETWVTQDTPVNTAWGWVSFVK